MTNSQILRVRAFNRFYTNFTGLLDEHIHDSPFALPEARLIYELQQRQPCTARELTTGLKMDKGYMSRVLSRFEKQGLIEKTPSRKDGRAMMLRFTTKGQREFQLLLRATMTHVASVMKDLSAHDTARLLGHMNSIIRILKKTNHGKSLA